MITNRTDANTTNDSDKQLDIQLVIRARPGQAIKVEIVCAEPLPILRPMKAINPLEGVRFADMIPSHRVIEDPFDSSCNEAQDEPRSITIDTPNGSWTTPAIFGEGGNLIQPQVADRARDSRPESEDRQDTVWREGHDRVLASGETIWIEPHEIPKRKQCSRCHRWGHNKATCGRDELQPGSKPERTPGERRCGHCGEAGHYRKTCELLESNVVERTIESIEDNSYNEAIRRCGGDV